MQYLEILVTLNALLMGVVGFFLKGLHVRFQQLEAEVKNGLISTAVEAQRIKQIEKDLAEVKQIVMSSLFKSISTNYDRKTTTL